MKRLHPFIVYALCLVNFNIVSGQNCKPFNQVQDNDITYNIYGATMSSGTYRYDRFTSYLFLINDGSASHISLQLNYTEKATKVEYDGKPVTDFETGSSFELIFENGESIFVKSTSAQKSTKGILKLTVNLSARIKNEEISNLSINKIDKIKINPYLENEDFFYIDLRGNKSEKLLEQFNCFNEMNFDNSAEVFNPRKSNSLMELGDTYLIKGKFDKAKEYYIKSIEAGASAINNLKLIIVNSAINPSFDEFDVSQIEKNIKSIRSSVESDTNIKKLENLLNNLILIQPDNTKLEEIMLLLVE